MEKHEVTGKGLVLRITRASEIGPAAPVLAGPVFSQGKNKIKFLQRANNKVLV